MSVEDRAYFFCRDGLPKFDAFSHSEQCNKQLEQATESAHVNCHCRCHSLALRLDHNVAPDFTVSAAEAQAYEAENADAIVGQAFTEAANVYAADDMPTLTFAEKEADCDLCGDPMSACECVE